MQEKFENNTLHLIPFSHEVLFCAIQSDLNFEPQAKAKNKSLVLQKAWQKITDFLGSRPDLVFLEIPRIVRIKLLIDVLF